MKWLFSLVVALFVLLSAAACRPANPPPGSSQCAQNKRLVMLYTTDPWTGDEMGQIEDAARAWSTLSADRIHIVVMWGVQAPPGGHQVRRLMSTDPFVTAEDAKQAATRALPTFTGLGWSPNGDVYLVVDRLTSMGYSPKALQHLFGHEAGHAADLMWPNCKDGPDQHCIHSPDPDAQMAAYFSDKDLGPADLAFCQASCLCP